jgi:hypothetical protein
MTQREVATMNHTGEDGNLRSKCIRLSRSEFRDGGWRSSSPPVPRPPRILQGVPTNLAVSGRNER